MTASMPPVASDMRFLVVSPQTSGNSLGRALSVMEVLDRIGAARLAVFETGPLWPGAEGSRFPIERFDSFEGLQSLVRRATAGQDRPLVLVAVKPFPRTLGWCALLRKQLGGAVRLIADLDDADVSIQQSWRRDQPLGRRVRRALGPDRAPDVHTPRAIRRTLRSAFARTDAIFLSSWALAEELPRFDGPRFRIPHPRPRHEYLPPTTSERLRLGFLGTPRSHKGFDVLLDIIAARSHFELHILEGTPLPPRRPSAGADRVVTHPIAGAETLPFAFREVDVVVLPQSAARAAGRLQLPAKLLDAQRFGRPVVATGTPPIRELGGPALVTVDQWDSLEPGLAALDELGDRAHRERLGRAANEWFNETIAAEALAEGLVHPLAEALALAPSPS